MDIPSLRELVDLAEREGLTLGGAALKMQVEQDRLEEGAVREKMRAALTVMLDSVRQGMNPETKSVSA